MQKLPIFISNVYSSSLQQLPKLFFDWLDYLNEHVKINLILVFPSSKIKNRAKKGYF